MDIYIRSRGVEQNQDYCWLQVRETEQKRVDDLPSPFQYDSKELIYSQSPSVVLSRRNSLLLLLITAIQPEGREDFGSRLIRISVAWIAETSDETEQVFRILAIRALEEQKYQLLTEEISEAVTLGGQEGFQGCFEKLLSLATLNKVESKLQNKPLKPDLELNRLATLSSKMKSLLANEIEEYCLPKREGVLLVSTSAKKEETLREAQVWRGLSSLVKSDNRWWIYYPLPDSYPFPETDEESEKSRAFIFKIKFLQFILKTTNLWEIWFINLIESQINMRSPEEK